MRAKPFIIGALLSLVVIAAAFAVAAASRADKYEPQAEGSYAVTAGEIENLINAGDTQAAVLKAQQLKADARLAKNSRREGSNVGIWIVCAVAVVIVNGCIAYIYFSILKPFRRLEKFADKIALGDFSEALDIERGNYFGKFTWAFDSMRREIIKSRSCEREALENNKTVIASLSHDLKTPVASISAYSEALVNGLYSSTEEMYSYLDVISKKCEEIAKITGDMITHSIGELGALKMETTHFDLVQLLESAVSESSVGGDVHFEKPLFTAPVCADENRLKQLVGNLIGNAQKYAGGKMDITLTKKSRMFAVHFRDYGQGIPDSELPFVLDKFYRGSNTDGKSGSGLGLYIVKYIAQQSGGDVVLENKDKGLEVTVTIPQDTNS